MPRALPRQGGQGSLVQVEVQRVGGGGEEFGERPLPYLGEKGEGKWRVVSKKALTFHVSL